MKRAARSDEEAMPRNFRRFVVVRGKTVLAYACEEDEARRLASWLRATCAAGETYGVAKFRRRDG